MDIKKAFDSLDPNFLIFALEKCDFGQNFILSVKVLLKDQESCVINGRKTTEYFLFGRAASVFIYFSVRDLLPFIKTKPEIARLTILDHCYFYSINADDTTFFLKDAINIKNVWCLLFFTDFSGLKPNLSNFDAGIGVLKGVQVKPVVISVV